MERVIKFRGQNAETGEWVYGDLLHHEDGFMSIRGCKDKYTSFNVDVKPDTIGQFINDYDCGDNEIYEGDVVEWDNDAGVRCFGFIRHRNGRFCICNLSYTVEHFMGCSAHIIGNIHDNPKLIKKFKLK
jgi:uncharacterized phage protein (TIGR01671 family)